MSTVDRLKRASILTIFAGLLALIPACDRFERRLELEVSNESANEVVVSVESGSQIVEGMYVRVVAGEDESIELDRPDQWTVYLDGEPVTASDEWPSDNPTIDLAINVGSDGSVDVVDE